MTPEQGSSTGVRATSRADMSTVVDSVATPAPVIVAAGGGATGVVSLPPAMRTPAATKSLLLGLVRLARPRQWIKNLLVFAAPGAAGVLGHGSVVQRALAVFGIFCLASAGTYFVNDTLDVAADRQHPQKRRRPVASGEVPESVALASGALLLSLSAGLAWLLAGGRLAGLIAAYVAIQVAYCVRLKHEPVVDLACVSSGFVLRTVAGGLATGVALSNWLLIVISFAALFVVTGKRSAELAELGDDPESHRRVLAAYPATFLRSVRLMAVGVTLTAYCLWAFERARQGGIGHHPVWFELSIVPVVIALLQVELRFERGQGGAPEDLALGDRALQVLGVLWLVVFAIGVYS